MTERSRSIEVESVLFFPPIESVRRSRADRLCSNESKQRRQWCWPLVSRSHTRSQCVMRCQPMFDQVSDSYLLRHEKRLSGVTLKRRHRCLQVLTLLQQTNYRRATGGIGFDMGVRLPNRHYPTNSWRPPTSRRWNNDSLRGDSGMVPPVDNAVRSVIAWVAARPGCGAVSWSRPRAETAPSTDCSRASLSPASGTDRPEQRDEPKEWHPDSTTPITWRDR